MQQVREEEVTPVVFWFHHKGVTYLSRLAKIGLGEFSWEEHPQFISCAGAVHRKKNIMHSRVPARTSSKTTGMNHCCWLQENGTVGDKHHLPNTGFWFGLMNSGMDPQETTFLGDWLSTHKRIYSLRCELLQNLHLKI